MRWLICLAALVWRELLRFVNQRSRFIGALVRPLLWLLVFATGFRSALGLAIAPPYETYIPYSLYVVPGLAGMVQLFNAMQSSLSMVYDREMGSMRALLVSPLPRWYLITCKLIAGIVVSILQVYAFLLVAWLFDDRAPVWGYVAVLPALLANGLMLGALGLLLSSLIRQLENFAGVMNFVVFPLFFLSTALYPLWKITEGSDLLAAICAANPFTYGVELIRFALWGQVDWLSLAVVVGAGGALLAAAIAGYSPARGLIQRKAGGE
jgi:ABC-2 type transport system permease protein